MRVTVALVDDHPLVLSGLRRLIERDRKFEIVGEYADAESAIKAIRRLQPDICVVDMKLAQGDGLQVLDAVVGEALPTRVVLLAALLRDSDIRIAVERGVFGLLLKEWAADSLLDCLNAVAAGRHSLPPDLVSGALGRESAKRLVAESLLGRLTPREREVALLAADGIPVKEIAHRLGISDGTTKLHLHAVFRKLGVTKRAEMADLLNGIRDHVSSSN